MAQSKVSPWGFVGIGGMACMLFLDLGTANVAPWWVTILFVLLWLVLFPWQCAGSCRSRRWVPVAARWAAFVVWLPTIVARHPRTSAGAA